MASSDELLPLIAARCGRCHRVAAKYWERGDNGHWYTPEPFLPNGGNLQYMVATRVCQCEPSPILPEGEELAALIARAHAEPFDRRRARAGRAPVTIRV
jgi:hypothetical protein